MHRDNDTFGKILVMDTVKRGVVNLGASVPGFRCGFADDVEGCRSPRVFKHVRAYSLRSDYRRDLIELQNESNSPSMGKASLPLSSPVAALCNEGWVKVCGGVARVGRRLKAGFDWSGGADVPLAPWAGR